MNRERALDIGCGSGLLTSALADHYQQVIGIDIADNMLAIALAKRSRANIQYQHKDANHLHFEIKFDLIVSNNVFHHLENVPQTLNSLKSLLAPKGKLVLADVISERETPPTIVYVVGAIQEFVPNCFKFGMKAAIRVFKFRTSKYWLSHLASDRYLSAQRFCEIYGEHLPGCVFPRHGGVIWEKPNDADREHKSVN
jgi:2-polyprenyl-3-methyl-5-hydroxy-6-metoxy-1,4-benzoquinol methylase